VVRALVCTLVVGLARKALAESAPPSRFTLTVEGHAQDFIRYPNFRLTLSASCEQKDHSLRCRAFEAWPTVTWKGVDHDALRGGANPGAVLCARRLGTLVIGTTANGSEQSFCRFDDGSMLGTGSITYAASNPDEVRKWHRQVPR
jgi:putative hemolysin